MEDVIAFFASAFPPEQRECAACMRLVAEHTAAAGGVDELEAVAFNYLGFGLFAPDGASHPLSPYIGVWFDDPYPLYWVQIRDPRQGDGELVACEQCFGTEDAVAAVREFVPRLLGMVAGADSRAE